MAPAGVMEGAAPQATADVRQKTSVASHVATKFIQQLRRERRGHALMAARWVALGLRPTPMRLLDEQGSCRIPEGRSLQGSMRFQEGLFRRGVLGFAWEATRSRRSDTQASP